MFRKGRRLFTAAAITLVVIATLHTIGFFLDAPEPGSNVAAVEAAMSLTRIELGAGMSPSIGDIVTTLHLSFSITLFGFAIMMFAIASTGSARMVRVATVAMAAIVGSMVMLFGVYQILPPFMLLFVSELVLVAAIAGGTPDDSGVVHA